MVRFTAFDIRSYGLSGPRRAQAVHSSAGHEGSFTLDHINDVGFFIVHLDLAGRVAVTAGHRKIRRGDEGSTSADGRCHFVVADKGDLWRSLGRGYQEAHREYCREC